MVRLVLFLEEPLYDVNDREFDVALRVVFKNKVAHDQYPVSEKHVKLIAENKESLKKVRVFDSYVEAFARVVGEKTPLGQTPAPGAELPIVTRARANAARTQIALLKTPLGVYELDVGEYPSTAQGLQALLEAPKGLAQGAKWSGPYLAKEVPLDPWKRPYRYRFPGIHAASEPDIWSSGPDGIDGTEDDIGNWEKK